MGVLGGVGGVRGGVSIEWLFMVIYVRSLCLPKFRVIPKNVHNRRLFLGGGAAIFFPKKVRVRQPCVVDEK